MPWRHTSPMDQKTPCIADDLRRTLSMTELCALYGVSRQTGDTWIDRDLTPGPPGLEERSRKPSSSPNQTPQHVVEAFIGLRRHHPSWGAKTLLAILQKRHPSWPLALHGLRSLQPPWLGAQDTTPATHGPSGEAHQPAPDSQRCLERRFPGPITTGDGFDGDPLTVADGDRRFLRGCQALASTRVAEANPMFTRLFKAFGVPKRLRTDHGVPSAPNPLGPLSHLSAWGSSPNASRPAHPSRTAARHARISR